jgi:hypothetical protein
VGDRVVLDGAVGLGALPGLVDFDPPPPGPAADPPPVRPVYGLDVAPVGVPLRPLGAHVSADAARRVALDELGQAASSVPAGVVHPWYLAARMAPLTRHNFTYGPTIHVRTQIEHRRRTRADQELVIGARIVEVYERNGHAYQVLDGAITGSAAPGDGIVARLRHHTIFRPRGTTPPPPIVSA